MATMREPDGKSLGAIPTAMGGMTRLAYTRARQAGIAVEPLLAKAGLAERQVQDRSERINVRQQIEFLDIVAQAVDDRLLGFHLAQTCDLREFGLPYYAAASAQTLGDAFRRSARYSSTANEGLGLRYVEDRQVRIMLHSVGVPRHIDRHQIECCMTLLVRLSRQLTGRDVMPRLVEFTHRRNAETSELSAFFGSQVDFGAPADQATFQPSFKDLAVVSADPYLNELLNGYREEALARRAANRGSFRAQVENAMVPLLPHGMARAGEVARILGVSQRSLARRLATEGATFSDVLVELRGELAGQYLADQCLSISQVAWLLGYRELSAFTHAFKRRTGTTPRQARAAQDVVRS
jgi:AraC-like DNA-binding protein